MKNEPREEIPPEPNFTEGTIRPAVAALLTEQHSCVDCGCEVGQEFLLCAPCHEARLERRKVFAWDAWRQGRTLADLNERYCAKCGFSFWRVSPTGDGSCYPCELLERGITPRRAGCKRGEWSLADDHRVCRDCEATKLAGGECLVAAALGIAAPDGPPCGVSEPGGDE